MECSTPMGLWRPPLYVILVFYALLIVSFIGFPCTNAETASPPPSFIKLGIGASLTGPNAALGERLKVGALQAIEDINARGGILGRRIDVVVGDDGGDPKQAIIVANQFITQGIHFVIGHNTSGTSIPVSEVYADSDVLQITPTSTNPKYTDRGLWNTIRVIGRDDQQGRIAGHYIAQHFKGKKIALVHDKTPYGKGLVDELRKILLEEHIKPAFYEGINPGEKDYSALVSRLKVAGVDLVYCGSFLVECGLIRRQMYDHDLHAVLMAGDICASEEFGAIAGPAILGTLLTAPPDPQNNPYAQDVVATFKRHGIESESATLYAYAAVQVLKEAIESAHSLDAMVISETIRSGMPFKTVLGPISFDKKGDIKGDHFAVYRWIQTPQGGYKYEEIKDASKGVTF